ncbi:hypothetical protein [Amycolatopsis sp. DSM 110486]|nr:hypothetical protein [Amycolatopsis sp. DSM 110486]
MSPAIGTDASPHDGHPNGSTLAEANSLLVPAGQKIAQGFQGT